MKTIPTLIRLALCAGMTATQKSYAKSFTAPTPPTNMFTIGVGSGSSY